MKKIKSFFATFVRAVVSALCIIILLSLLGSGAFLAAGSILEREAKKLFGLSETVPQTDTVIPSETEQIGLEEAKAAALSDANLTVSEVTCHREIETYQHHTEPEHHREEQHHTGHH